MRFTMYLASVLGALITLAALPASSQVAPSAIQGGLPLVLGAGFSDYNIDWGNGRREDGGTVYVDWTVRQLPKILQGLGVEAITRDITINAPANLDFFQYETAGGGILYHYLRPRRFHPYVKGLDDVGKIKFAPGYPPGSYNNDTRSYFAFGGGADFHAWRHVWIRADYEYQMWKQLFNSPNALTPNGFTVGPQYDFRSYRTR